MRREPLPQNTKTKVVWIFVPESGKIRAMTAIQARCNRDVELYEDHLTLADAEKMARSLLATVLEAKE
jgi:hypothetical protein